MKAAIHGQLTFRGSEVFSVLRSQLKPHVYNRSLDDELQVSGLFQGRPRHLGRLRLRLWAWLDSGIRSYR